MKVTSFYKEAASAVDAGLRKYMLSVFSHMSIGLAITAFVAYFVSCSPWLIGALFSSQLLFAVVVLVPLGISIYMTTKLASISVETARTLFVAYSACLGISLSTIFVVYSGTSIACTFFVTSSMFLSMVIYGYVTEKDLTSLGSFLFMGLIGILIASVVNIFMQSSMAMLVISAIGVVIFTGLTAYDTQSIKSYYFDSDEVEVSDKKAIYGALRLYMDFINLFLYMLRFLGSRRN